jgi:regulator of RNase E activity RraA
MTLPSTCDLSDACDALGVHACRSGAILPAWPGCPRVVGRIATVTLAPGAGEPLGGLLDAIADADAELLLVDVGGRTDVQSWGTVLATAAVHHGLAGAIVEGGTRDVGGLAEMGFPTFARGVSPVTSRRRLELVGVGLPVTVGGGAVEPGWIAAADANGVVLFPAEHAGAVVAEAKRLLAAEEEQLAAIRGGGDPRAVLLSG